MSKVLVCFFSAGGEDLSAGQSNEVGNTAMMAKAIINKLKEDGHDVTSFRIQPKEPYPDSYDQKLVKATEERAMQERPEYDGDVADFDDYDTVFIGFPIWCSDMPMIIYSFLEKHVFTGKIVVPFCTHGGGGAGRFFDDVKKSCPEAKVLEGLVIRGSNQIERRLDIGVASHHTEDDVVEWLNRIFK